MEKTESKWPTWNKWLHDIFKNYETGNNHNFLEWLNTPIPENEAKRFNIPIKKELQ
jgi:hypothetical protein